MRLPPPPGGGSFFNLDLTRRHEITKKSENRALLATISLINIFSTIS
jgi:hypothetical protein